MFEEFLRFSKKYLLPKPVFRAIQPVYHYLLAYLGSLIFGAPSKKLFVVGVTGTKGKTTALELINACLEAGGKKTALFSSVCRKIGERRGKNPTETTMPGRFALQKFFREAVRAGCDYALVEVTSEGIVKHRHRFINWDGAVFLNIHPEHIEAHGSFEAYLESKLNFFRCLKRSSKEKKYFFVNKDDAHASRFSKAAEEAGGTPVLFSRSDVAKLLGGIRDKYDPDWLKADFNAENAAAAVAVAKATGVRDEDIRKALRNFKGLKGRMDFVQKEPFAVVVDYAHTPGSLRAVYESLKPNRLICVLGSAGGGRDKWKRPELGRIAAEHCDRIILTNEDPYDENPASILDQIEAGFSQIPNSKFQIPKNYWKILDRKEAIEKAVSLARKGDAVVITGKGSEEWIHVANGKKIPWDDRKVVEEIL